MGDPHPTSQKRDVGHPDFLAAGCSAANEKLVEADEVGAAFGGLEEAGNLFGGAVRFAIGANADPVAGGALEVDDIGSGIFALEFLL